MNLEPNHSADGQHRLFATWQGRQRVLNVALWLAQDTPLAPQAQEQHLLDLFVAGLLTLDQVLVQLDQ